MIAIAIDGRRDEWGTPGSRGVECTDLNKNPNNNAQSGSLYDVELSPSSQVLTRRFCRIDKVGSVRLLRCQKQLLLNTKDVQELHAVCLEKSDSHGEIDAHDPVFCDANIFATHRI